MKNTTRFKISNFKKKQYIALNNWGFDKLHIQKFWNFSKGRQVKIAVLDSGVPTHVDLIINKTLARNFVMTENDGDHFGHSTSIIGLLNAQYNFNDIEGICPEAEIIPIKVLDFEGGGEEKDIKKALEYCLYLKPDIINLSFGSPDKLGRDFEDILLKLKNLGVFVICASGNKGSNSLDYPASSEHTIAVGSIDETDTRSIFSSYGEGIDFVFPGSNLYTTCNTNRYCYVTGTSFATPIFTGILALYLGYLKNLNIKYSFGDVMTELERCALDLGAVGKDDMFGYGSINLDCIFSNKNQQIATKTSWYQRFLHWVKAIKN